MVQAYKSQLIVGNTAFPVLLGSGTALNTPKNYRFPRPTSNWWSVTHCNGLLIPTLTVSYALIDDGGLCPLNYFHMDNHFWNRPEINLQRSMDWYDSQLLGGGLTFYDGYSGIIYPYAKGESFTISGSKATGLSLSAMYYAWTRNDNPLRNIYNPPVAYADGFNGSPLSFQDIIAPAQLPRLLAFSLTVKNNHHPNTSMVDYNTEDHPYDMHVGEQTCVGSFDFEADTELPLDGVPFTFQFRGQFVNFSLTFNNPVWADTGNRQIGEGRQRRKHSCRSTGKTKFGIKLPPATFGV